MPAWARTTGRLLGNLFSPVDEVARDLVPRATGPQYLAALQKNPLVNNEELRDRGLENFLAGRTDPMDLADLQAELQLRPTHVPDYLSAGDTYGQYATPGLEYWEKVAVGGHVDDSRLPDDYEGTIPRVESRVGSEAHYPDYPGYQYHTRGNQGMYSHAGGDPQYTRIVDEIQSDIARDFAKEFDPGMGRLSPMRREDLDYADAQRAYFDLDDRNIMLEMDYDLFAPAGWVDHRAEGGGAWGRNMRASLEEVTDHYPDTSSEVAELTDYLDRIESYGNNMNLPMRKTWEWNALARELDNAVNDPDVTALSWPSADVQGQRYYQANIEDMLASNRRNPRNTAKAYLAEYDKRLPGARQLQQLDLKPERRALAERFNTGDEPLGDYWSIDLPPETKERLKKSGIPFYGLGAPAALGLGALYGEDEEDEYYRN
jgi:hypothetical protein